MDINLKTYVRNRIRSRSIDLQDNIKNGKWEEVKTCIFLLDELAHMNQRVKVEDDVQLIKEKVDHKEIDIVKMMSDLIVKDIVEEYVHFADVSCHLFTRCYEVVQPPLRVTTDADKVTCPICRMNAPKEQM